MLIRVHNLLSPADPSSRLIEVQITEVPLYCQPVQVMSKDIVRNCSMTVHVCMLGEADY